MEMIDFLDQVDKAAYARWERRGRIHGFDRQDWLAAEASLRFEQTYRVVVRHRCGGDVSSIGNALRRRCRFCSQSAPRALFSDDVPIFEGCSSPLSLDQCDSCASAFSETIDRDLSQFLSGMSRAKGISIGAFKGLVKMALAILPDADLDDHEDTVEWVTNPDHAFDFNVFRGLSSVIHTTAIPYPTAWCAVAEKIADDSPWPSRLFFLGNDRHCVTVPIPLNPRDEDLDLTGEILPDVAPPNPFGWECDPVATSRIPIVRED